LHSKIANLPLALQRHLRVRLLQLRLSLCGVFNLLLDEIHGLLGHYP